MSEVSVTKIPKPEDRKVGECDLMIGWFPEPLLPIERRILDERGAELNQIGGRKGFYITNSLGIIPYDDAERIKEQDLMTIKQSPEERFLAIYVLEKNPKIEFLQHLLERRI